MAAVPIHSDRGTVARADAEKSGATVLVPIIERYALKLRIVPVPVGVNGTEAGADAVNVSTRAVKSP